MKTIKVTFTNQYAHELSARIEMPVNKRPRAYALFAHCFTCDKNLMAVTNISRALTSKGIAVMRFDFTGLGESEGDFADTNFSSNVEDLLCAADYLKHAYEAPKIIIGHSLGGAAVLMAAASLDSVEAIATIGAPADPPHVKHLFQNSIEEISETGFAKVSIGGRPFTIKKQFIDDLEKNDLATTISNLKKPLIVFHSPQDSIVDIVNAEKIYKAAHHPKSYVSLDGANHLLTNKRDAQYVGEVIAAWADRYVNMDMNNELDTDHQVVVRNEAHNGLLAEINANDHYLIADEPKSVGGTNAGGTPYDLLVSALGACTALTLRLYAQHKKIDLEEIKVHLTRDKRHAADAENLDETSLIEFVDMELELTGSLSTDQRNRMLEIAHKCPVHKTLTHGLTINVAART
jgi:uncharacterized OsmC-like protein/esterase/lipase